MPFTSLQTINVGTFANDGTGDDLRSAFEKVNSNFASLAADLLVNNAENIGNGTGLYAGRADTKLQFKSLVAGNGVTLSNTATTVTINAGITRVQDDATPSLGGNLNLNGNNIVGMGDVQTTVYNIDVRQLSGKIQLLLNDLDLSPNADWIPNVEGDFDMGVF